MSRFTRKTEQVFVTHLLYWCTRVFINARLLLEIENSKPNTIATFAITVLSPLNPVLHSIFKVCKFPF